MCRAPEGGTSCVGAGLPAPLPSPPPAPRRLPDAVAPAVLVADVMAMNAAKPSSPDAAAERNHAGTCAAPLLKRLGPPLDQAERGRIGQIALEELQVPRRLPAPGDVPEVPLEALPVRCPHAPSSDSGE